MKKKLLTTLFLTLLTAVLTASISVFAEEPTGTPTPTEGQSQAQSRSELEKKIAEYEQKLGEVRSQKNTLSAQIEYMDTQLYIAELRINQTEAKITETEKEIDVLGARITNLDSSLDQLSETLLQRIVAGYKNRSANTLDILLDSTNVSKLVNRLKYYQLARDRNQKALLQVQEAKSNFEEQKDLREKKAEQLASLKTTLDSQKLEVSRQQDEKRVLLTATQNDEAKYSALLEEARRQIAAFKSFVRITGAGIISADGLGTGEGGWYLSQRDERWAGAAMGSSSESVLDVGCFITSISMVMRHDGVSGFTPLELASNPKYFVPGTAYMYIPSNFNGSWPNGKNYRNISSSQLSDYLNRGIPVIAGVRGSSHYVVLKKVDGSDYIMNDPIYGPDKKVSDYYSLSGPYGVFE
ncbi:C39 family peptidase [Candidatus Roizmanbacteria bacterium]|nr:MAG: C39 family peptidase [Candidatus Roizmanbacteria bacterium]